MIEDGINIDQYQSLLISEFVDTTYELGTKNIKKRALCIWDRSKINVIFGKLAHGVSMCNTQ